MPNRIKITPAMFEALAEIVRGGRVSNTMARSLSKLGWVRIRETKVYDAAGPHKLFDVRVTGAGRAWLQVNRVKETTMSELMRVGDVVRHKISGLVGKVERFAHDGTTDVWIDGTGPYKQNDFEILRPPTPKPGEPGGPELATPNADGFTCTCRTFSECTHK